jgi:hypothetical protein
MGTADVLQIEEARRLGFYQQQEQQQQQQGVVLGEGPHEGGVRKRFVRKGDT